ncbi:MAG: DUF4376 domain-containing protein [Desulfobacula sp.]|nr:DUF4376 domain-containing protein [Desulfobacula sp.]
MNTYKNPATGEVIWPGKNPKNISFSENATDQEYAAHGYYLIVKDSAYINPMYQFHGKMTEIIDDGKRQIVQSWPILEKPIADVLENKKQELKTIRQKRETAGVIYNKMTFSTDRESLAMLHSIYTLIKDGLVTSVDWKCEKGFTSLDKAGVNNVIGLVMNHIQTCFTDEKKAIEDIESLMAGKEITEYEMGI